MFNFIKIINKITSFEYFIELPVTQGKSYRFLNNRPQRNNYLAAMSKAMFEITFLIINIRALILYHLSILATWICIWSDDVFS